MEESDDDFTELFTNPLRRIKRSRAEGEEEGIREVQNGNKTSTAKGKLKKTKTTVTKGKRQDGKVRKKVEQCEEFAGSSKEVLEPALDGTNGGVKRQVRSEQQIQARDEKSRAGGNGDQNTENPAQSLFQNGFQDFCPPAESVCPASGESAPRSTPMLDARPQAVELILQRMQQFKRGDPERLKHGPVERSAEVGMQQCFSAVCQKHTSPIVENDVVLTLDLQQKVRQEGEGENTESLEEEGCYFCQICQKDLAAMNSALREQHVNRCLDEAENPTSMGPSLQRSSIPECPICGKQFNTVKSRAAHLKRCAIQMQVSPQLLLQAVQRQAASPVEGLHTGTSGQVVGSKRKGSAKDKEAAKKKKAIPEDSEIENLLVAMVMSRSLLQQDSAQLTDIVPSADSRLENNFPIQIKPGTEKKNRKKRKEAPLLPLLIQDPASVLQQIQQRVALLLTEDDESPNTPMLSASRFWEEGAPDAAWHQTLSRCRHSKLWESSSLQESHPPESYYTDALVPPLSVWKPPQQKENIPLPRSSERPQRSSVQASFIFAPEPAPDVHVRSAGDGEAFKEPVRGTSNSCQALSHSQKERRALQDLTELAKEGLTLTQCNLGVDQIHQIQRSGNGSEASDIVPSGFVPSPSAKKRRRRGSHCTLPLDTLAVDFSGMVNSPHLSDVQLQMDSGDILYTHKFVLYARCPQLFQLVLSEGFLVEEDGNERMCRVLLNDVSAEAVCAFLQYLYSASTDIPLCLRSHVVALALRFGVRELIDICENSPIDDQENNGYCSEDDLFSQEKEEDDDSRAENFQELLKSVWVDEDEETLAGLEAEGQGEDEEQENEKVDEHELEEIYEFAATQRKVVEDEEEIEDTEGGLTCADEGDQDVHQQKDDGTMLESLSTKRTSENLQESFVECLDNANWESSKQESEYQGVPACEDLCSTNISVLECSENSSKCSKDTQFERISVVVNCSRISKASGDKKEKDPNMSRSQGSDGDLNDSYDQMFSQSWGEYLEPPQVAYQIEDHEWIINENDGKVSKSPVLDKIGWLQKHQSLETDCFRNDNIIPPVSALPAVGLTPSSPKTNRACSKMSPLMQNHLLSSPGPLQNKKTCVLHFDELFQKTNQQACSSSCGNKEVKDIHDKLVSPLKYPFIELSKQSHTQSLSSSFSDETKKPSSLMCHQKEDVIILLDSDEEMESDKNMKLISSPLSRGRDTSPPLALAPKKTVKDAQSSEPDILSVVCSGMASSLLKIPGEMHSGNDLNLPLNEHCTSYVENSSDKLKLEQSCERNYSHEESTDISWVVPATPLTSKSQHISMHTQTTSFCLLPKTNQKAKRSIEGPSVDHSSRKLVKNITAISKTLSDLLTKPASGTHVLSNTEDKDIHADTLEKQSSVDCLSVSPVPPALFSQCSTKVKSKPPGSSLSPNQELSGLTQTVQNKSLGSSIFEIEDSEDDQEMDPFSLNNSYQLAYEPPIPADDDCWHIDNFAPVEVNNKEFIGNGRATTSSPGSKSDRGEKLTKSMGLLDNTPTKSTDPNHSKASLLVHENNHLQANLSQDSFFDHWDREDNEFPKVQPLCQRLSSSQPAQNSKEPKTPVAVCHNRNQVPRVPITPVPAYSDMDTPKLKKELNSFGVRPLPKRQMVLKLREIFQYTHQTLSSDSEDEILSSELQQQKLTASQPVSASKSLKLAASTSSAVRKRQPVISGCSQVAPINSNADVTEKSSGASHQRFKRPPKKMTRQENTKALSPASSPAKDRPLSTCSRQQLTASQESTGSSAASSDNSFGSQSSLTNDFEMAFSAGEEKEDAEEAVITPSQAAVREKDRTEALRHYIRLNPELHRKILLYQPLELAELQAELKQNGIKISAGKLLDFLDAHCITFTTAAARKEKLQKKQSKGKRKGGKH